MTRSLTTWMVGPIVGLLLLATAFLVGFGPGFFTLAILGAAGFIFLAPMLQLALGRTVLFRNRQLLSCGLALSVIVIAIAGAVVSRRYFYW
jgi:hypothetical protein